MSLMSKLSIVTAITTAVAIANFDIESYVKKDLIKNPRIKVNSVKIIEKKKLEKNPNWSAYLIIMNLNMRGKDDTFPETILVNEKENLVIAGTKTLYDYKNKSYVAKNYRPKLNEAEFYNKEHLIAGNPDAKHKLVVISDPMCPFCRKYVPGIYADVKAHPKDFALYYYHLPLNRIHPASGALTRAMESLQKKGKIDEAMKIYNLSENLYKEKDEDKLLAELKKQLQIELTKEDINNPEIKKAVDADVEQATNMFVKGTPTVYLDGKLDKKTTSYKELIK